jgi:GAF domain-containing protein
MQNEGKRYEELAAEASELRRRVDELERANTALKISEEALKLDEARLEALLKLAQMSGASELDIANFALEEAVRLTGSDVGWMGAVDDSGSLVTLYNFSSGARQECGVIGRPHSFSLKNAGVWALPIFRRAPVIMNDYRAPCPEKKGFPEGHIELRNFLAVPVFDDARVVAVAEVGNKTSDYDRSDVRQLALLMAGMWPIILRKRAEEQLRQAKLQAELYVDLMGHDINNMNQIAIGFLELALQTLDTEKSLTSKHRFLLEKPVDTLHNSTRLIKNVKKLKSARGGGLATKIMDLDGVLASVREEHSRCPGERSRSATGRSRDATLWPTSCSGTSSPTSWATRSSTRRRNELST